MIKQTKKLVIFDCDGTLVDSEGLCNLALQYQLADIGIQYEADALLAKYRGVKFDTILARLEAELSVTLPKTFELDYRAKVSKLFDEQLVANDGVAELLASLQSRSVPFCVASSAPRKKIEQALSVTGLASYFKNIYSSYEVGSWKPDPSIFLHAAEQMQTAPVNCCVVEDSVVGLQAARNANMTAIYYAPNATAQHPLANKQINHMSVLINTLD